MSSASFHALNQDGYDSSRSGVLPRKPLAFSNQIIDNTDSSQPNSRPWYSHGSHSTYVPAQSDEAKEDVTNEKTDYQLGKYRSRLSFLRSNPVSNFRIPRFAAPWQHEQDDSSSSSSSSSSTVRSFSRKKQWRRIFVNSFIQWCLTFAIVLGEFGVLYGFSRADYLSKAQKYSFNALITLLSVCLGLAVVSALRSYAKLLSWRFLASGYHDLQDFELIMNCDSQTKVLKLFWAGRKYGSFGLNKTQLLCAISLLLVIGLQVTIALLGLTYSIDSANEWYQYQYGNVSLVDMSNIYQDSTYNVTNFPDQTGAANYYGLVGQSYAVVEAPLGKGNNGQEAIYTADNWTSFFYNFVDMAIPDAKSVTQSVVSSSRYATANATCVELDIISGGYVNQTNAWSSIFYTNVRGRKSFMQVYNQAALTTTYMTNTSDETYCGERCSQVYVLDTGYNATDVGRASNSSDILPHLYVCNSTISQVYNSDTCDSEWDCTLSDKYARYLAGSIGLTGTYQPGSSIQFKTYTPGSPLSWDGDDSGGVPYVAQTVSNFAAGAVAAMDSAGPRINVHGWYPVPTVALNVKWRYALPVLCVVPVIQFVVLLLVCIFANGALIKDGGYLAAARLLRPVVDKIGDHGCALTSDELARELGNFKIVYGVKGSPDAENTTAYEPHVSSSADWHVGVIAETEGYGKQAEEGWSVNATFPEGRYDGLWSESCAIEANETERLLDEESEH